MRKIFVIVPLGVFAAMILAVFVTAPSVPRALLGAAIGELNAPLLKLWQDMGGFSFEREPGDRGRDLLAIQKALATDPELNFIATPNGYFGEGTKAAIAAFQAEYNLPLTGVIDAATLAQLNQTFLNQLCPSPSTSYTDLSLKHVTKADGLPQDYVPPDLVNITGTVRTVGIQCVTRGTAQALEQMFAAAAQAGVELAVTSGFRRPDLQQLTHDFWIAVEGEVKADRGSALPFHSEHQLGTTVDLSGGSSGFTGTRDDFGATAEGAWVREHAHEFGFNQSYLGRAGEEYIAEPWHWRFVGIEVATDLHGRGAAYNDGYKTFAEATPPKPIEPAAGSAAAINALLLANKHLF